MHRDYEQKRVAGQIQKLKHEQEQIVQDILRAQKNEQFELKKIQRDFENRLFTLKSRQATVQRDILQKEKELQQLTARESNESSEQQSAGVTDKEQRLHRYR